MHRAKKTLRLQVREFSMVRQITRTGGIGLERKNMVIRKASLNKPMKINYRVCVR